MSKQLMKEFRERWSEVAEIEIEEQRKESVAFRWKQLNALWQLARDLGLSTPIAEREEEIVRLRWAKLKGLPL